MATRLLVNGRLATMATSSGDYGLVDKGAIAIEGDRIQWCGSLHSCPEPYADWQQLDLGGRLITPGLIDCHTHIVFGGHRAREFEMRLSGASYQQIAQAGGGIVSTVQATRGCSESELLESALGRVDALIAEGVCTIEIKSGYGLDAETELRMLRVARRIQALRSLSVQTSFLGAHALPAEHQGKPDIYIDQVCLPALKAAHAEGLVDAVDGFCENIGFSPQQIARVFKTAKELGLPVKLHAEQLSNLGGTVLATEYGALSVDHLEYLDSVGVEAMALAGTVAVLLPGAFYTLHENQLPPIDQFRKLGVPMAVATDCNPGSSPLSSILLAMNMASTLFGFTPEEALRGVTRHAAQALGLTHVGVIATGMRADLAIWDLDHPAELAYRIGFNALYQRISGGIL